MDFYEVIIRDKNNNYVKWDKQVLIDYLYTGRDIVNKGGKFYAFYQEDTGLWNLSKPELRAMMDRDIRKTGKEAKEKYPNLKIDVKTLSNHKSQEWSEFLKFEKQMDQSSVAFNQRILFSNDEPKREDYATHRLTYSPTEGITPNFDEMMSVLYRDDELEKIMWFIGALLTNSMKHIQKFLYLFGGKGTGKGTVIKIFKMLFEGYYAPIDLGLLTSTSEFATSQIQEVPLLIDEDTDITKITKDTNLLKMTAHEPISVNMKYKSPYEVTFNGLLITASNEPFKVKHIDAGITRRAVVAEPTGEKLDGKSYNRLMEGLKFEIPQIAQKAIDLFLERGPYFYDDYVAVDMMMETDYMFAFMREYCDQLGDPVTLKSASILYKEYLDDIGFDTNGYKRKLKNGLKHYYLSFDNARKIDGNTLRNVYSGLKREVLFPNELDAGRVASELQGWIALAGQRSEFDVQAATYPAQLANEDGFPKQKWDSTTTVLANIDTTKLHFVKLPQNHIVIDFDLKDEYGHKRLDLNLAAAASFPQTYVEVSKSGQGIHLHYNYEGDVSRLSSLYDDDIEIKVFKGNSSLRRKLTMCNDIPISSISGGLPLKEENKKVYADIETLVWTEQKMRTAIKRAMRREVHANTKPSMDWIAKIFEDAQANDLLYDLTDLRSDILRFASSSTNQSEYCVKLASKIVYSTIPDEKEYSDSAKGLVVPDEKLVFYDIEIFPNLFVVCYKTYGKKDMTKWINPSKEQIESLLKKPLVGFNNRNYDNHMLYGRLVGENCGELYNRSQRLIKGRAGDGYHKGAMDASYADIFEYNSTKQSLKKWEIEYGIRHDEMELPWDQPVPEHLWERVAEYCAHDVEATEYHFNKSYADYKARLILAELSGLPINADTKAHAAAFLFGDDPRPQDKFVYTDLSTQFDGYKFEFGKSSYRGEDPGEGGYVYSEPGVYKRVFLLDIESMHPHTLIALNYFGPYTARFAELVKTRMLVKHKQYDEARKMFDGALAPYLDDEDTAAALAYALKIIINTVYGLTSAKWDNKFKHPKNIDNIIAKRGALFMINLKHEVMARGGTVVHIKTDSIKIADPTPELVDFIIDYGHEYGYNFDLEHIYNTIALVNKSTYIANYDNPKTGEEEWEATGAQFAIPYVYKKLFTKEELEPKDFAITKQVAGEAFIRLGDRFIGKIGQVYASLTGQEAFRVARIEKDGAVEEKATALNGTKGHLWKTFDQFNGITDIDMAYYDDLAREAIKTIDKVGPAYEVIKEIPKEYELDALPF